MKPFPQRNSTGVLAGDLGGTKILLELSRARGNAVEVLFERRYAAAQYAGLEAILRVFLAEFAARGEAPPDIEQACFGVAGPVTGKRVRLTNLPWEIDTAALEQHLGIGSVLLVNDFVAAAHGLDELGPQALVTLQAGERVEHGNRIVLGAGTGFGVAYSIWTEGGYQAVAGEGGHAGFAPADGTQGALWRDIAGREGRVSVEHVVSGPGLLRIYDFLRRTAGPSESEALRAALDAGAGPEVISELAMGEHAGGAGDPLALAALDVFIACYGAAAGDHALALLARGGVYVSGGIAPKILPRLAAGGFVAAFNAKGPQAELMRRMPVHVVTEARVGLLGARRLAASGSHWRTA